MNTDKYTGHTSDWKWIDINEQDDFYLHSKYGDIINHDTPDGKLAQDAPLLLAEVKRLHSILGDIVEIDGHTDDGKDMFVTIKYADGYVFGGIIDKVMMND